MRYDRNCHCMYILHSDITVALSTCLNVHVLRCVHTCSTCTHTGIHTPQALLICTRSILCPILMVMSEVGHAHSPLLPVHVCSVWLCEHVHTIQHTMHRPPAHGTGGQPATRSLGPLPGAWTCSCVHSHTATIYQPLALHATTNQSSFHVITDQITRDRVHFQCDS